MEQSEADIAQERLRAEAENLRVSMEQLQRRVESQSSFARGERFAGLGSVRGLAGQSPARRATGSGLVPSEFQNMASSNSTKQIKDVPFSHAVKTEFPNSQRDLITLAKQHGLFRFFTEDAEIPVANEEKSVEEVQALDFTQDEIWKHFLAWNIPSRAIKGKTDNHTMRRVTSPTAAWRTVVGSYSATTRGANLKRMKGLTNRRVNTGSNPIHTCKIADDARDLRANGTDISD